MIKNAAQWHDELSMMGSEELLDEYAIMKTQNPACYDSYDRNVKAIAEHRDKLYYMREELLERMDKQNWDNKYWMRAD